MFVRYTPRSFQNPTALMDDVRRTMDLFFGDLDRAATFRGFEATWPRFEVEDQDQGIMIRAELPGVAPEQLAVSLDGTELTLESKPEVKLPDGYAVRQRERPHARWKRTMTLPYEVDAEQVKAKLEHGLLELWLPKHERAKPRQIPVNG